MKNNVDKSQIENCSPKSTFCPSKPHHSTFSNTTFSHQSTSSQHDLYGDKDFNTQKEHITPTLKNSESTKTNLFPLESPLQKPQKTESNSTDSPNSLPKTPSPSYTSRKEIKSIKKGDKGPITVKLESEDLWKAFHALNTEMVITKSGRWVGV